MTRGGYGSVDSGITAQCSYESPVLARAEAVRIVQAIAERGGNPIGVDTEYAIPGASKNGSGNVGYADIVYDDGNRHLYIWEVKGTTASNPPFVDQGLQASKEAAWYVSKAQIEENAQGSGVQVVRGFKLNQSGGFWFKNNLFQPQYY